MNKEDEKVLVVPANILFNKERWQGLKKDNLDYYLDLIKNNSQFKRRGDMETNPEFKQIIPYMLFSFGDKFFIYKYIKNAGEQRLINNDYQLGVGGHINEIDGEKDTVLERGMMREWEEEVNFNGAILEKKFVGVLNDDSRQVEQVHLGLVYHFVGNSLDIKIKETDKMEGILVKIDQLSRENISHSPWMNAVYKGYLLNLNNHDSR